MKIYLFSFLDSCRMTECVGLVWGQILWQSIFLLPVKDFHPIGSSCEVGSTSISCLVRHVCGGQQLLEKVLIGSGCSYVGEGEYLS